MSYDKNFTIGLTTYRGWKYICTYRTDINKVYIEVDHGDTMLDLGAFTVSGFNILKEKIGIVKEELMETKDIPLERFYSDRVEGDQSGKRQYNRHIS